MRTKSSYRLAETAAMVGVSVNTMRKLADEGEIERDPAFPAERRFTAEAIERFKRGEQPPEVQPNPRRLPRRESEPTRSYEEELPATGAWQAPAVEPSRARPEDATPSWERIQRKAWARVEVEKAEREIRRLRSEDAQVEADRARQAQFDDQEQATRQRRQAALAVEAERLNRLKQNALACLYISSAVVRAAVAADLERWCTSENVPATLFPFQQQDAVMEYARAALNARAPADPPKVAPPTRPRAIPAPTERERNELARRRAREAEDRELERREASFQARQDLRAMLKFARDL